MGPLSLLGSTHDYQATPYMPQCSNPHRSFLYEMLAWVAQIAQGVLKLWFRIPDLE